MFTSSEPLFFSDMLNDERVDETTKAIAQKVDYRSVAAIPLFIGSRRDALILLEGQKPHNFTQDEIRLFTALGPQLATILENRRQFERAQEQAKREAMLNAISQKIQSATTIESALQVTARELGHALGMKPTLVTLEPDSKNGESNKDN
jgi:GAF domain-containing protein